MAAKVAEAERAQTAKRARAADLARAEAEYVAAAVARHGHGRARGIHAERVEREAVKALARAEFREAVARAERERLERERIERERIEWERVERERIEKERAEKEKAEAAAHDGMLLHKRAERERRERTAQKVATIHVAVTAWKRYDYAETTLESFARWNALDRFALWCALDGGFDEWLPALFARYGFECLVRHEGPNVGIARLTDELVSAIGEKAYREDLVLLLQDDWESFRPVPVHVVDAVFQCEDIGAFRLTAAHRDRLNRLPTGCRGERWEPRAMPGEAGREPLPASSYAVRRIAGAPVSEAILVGRSYWAHPPTITRIGLARYLCSGARSERESITRSERMAYLTAWVTDRVFWHIGARRCRFMGGKE